MVQGVVSVSFPSHSLRLLVYISSPFASLRLFSLSRLHHINYTSKSITMHASTLLPVLFAVAAARDLEKRQSTTSEAAPEGTPVRLEDTVNSLCEPTRHIWRTGTLDEKRAAGLDQYDDEAKLCMSFNDSPFPCEKVYYYLASCTDSFISRNSQNMPSDPTQAKESPEDIKNERSCLCSPSSGAKGNGQFFELQAACDDCQSLHGYGDSDYTVWSRQQSAWAEARFCNETMPEKNYFSLVNSGEAQEDGSMPEFPSEGVDQASGKTEVGLYYTGTVKQETGSVTAMAQPTATGEGEGSGVAATTAAGGAAAASTTANGGAGEVKVGGGLMMAVMGAVLML